MGKKSSSSFSICGLFKACFSGGSGASDDYSYDEGVRTFYSDGDGGRWVAEPGIDGLATVFIDQFHATRVADSYGAVTATWQLEYLSGPVLPAWSFFAAYIYIYIYMSFLIFPLYSLVIYLKYAPNPWAINNDLSTSCLAD